MADRFDWKKVLRGPFAKQADRSTEVLFLPQNQAAQHQPASPVTQFGNLATNEEAFLAPPPVVQEEESYQPSLVLESQIPAPAFGTMSDEAFDQAVIPPPTVMDAAPPVVGSLIEDPTALQPISLDSTWSAPSDGPILPDETGASLTPNPLAAEAQMAMSAPPVVDEAPAPAPVLAPETAPAPAPSTTFQFPTISAELPATEVPVPQMQSVAPIDLLASIPVSGEPAEEPKMIELAADPAADQPVAMEAEEAPIDGEPSLSATTPHAAEILARFGVQKVPSRDVPIAAANSESSQQRELLGELERLLSGIEPAAAAAAAAPQPDPSAISNALAPVEPEALGFSLTPEPEQPEAVQPEAVQPVAVQPEPIQPVAAAEPEFQPEVETPSLSSVDELRTLLSGEALNPIHAAAPQLDSSLQPETPEELVRASAETVIEPILLAQPESSFEAEEAEDVPPAPEGELKWESLDLVAPEAEATADYEPELELEPEPIEESVAALQIISSHSPEPVVAEAAWNDHSKHNDDEDNGGDGDGPIDFGNEAAVLAYGALKAGASSLRLGPVADKCPVWFRIDGHMHHIFDFDLEEGSKIVAWFKHHSIAGKDDPAKGDYGSIDLDASHRADVYGVETKFGEIITVKMVAVGEPTKSLEELGFSDRAFATLKSMLQMPHGLVLLGAPLGHDVSEVTAATAKKLAANGQEVIYIGEADLSDEPLVRSFWLDPDRPETHALKVARATSMGASCIVVESVRDPHVAATLSVLARKGCLVFASVDASDTWSTLAAWQDMVSDAGVFDAPRVAGIVFRRQIRKLCSDCKSSAEITAEQLEEIHRFLPEANPENLWTPGDCDACYGIGFRGTASIHDVVALSDESWSMLYQDPTGHSLRKQLGDRGHHGIAHEALVCALCGMTAWSEVAPLLRAQ